MNYYDTLIEGSGAEMYYETHAKTKRARRLALEHGELEAWAAMVIIQSSLEETMPMRISY